jgi:hypothetical protein
VYFLLKTDLWTKTGIVPAFIILGDHTLDNQSSTDKNTSTASSRLIFVVTTSAAIVLGTPYNTFPTSVLGLSSAIFTAAGLVFFEHAITSTKDAEKTSSRGPVSANGSFSRRQSISSVKQKHSLASLRDVAIVMAVIIGAAAFFVESFRTDAITWDQKIFELGGDWKLVQTPGRIIRQCLEMAVVNTLKYLLLFATVSFPHLVRLLLQSSMLSLANALRSAGLHNMTYITRSFIDILASIVTTCGLTRESFQSMGHIKEFANGHDFFTAPSTGSTSCSLYLRRRMSSRPLEHGSFVF